MFHEINHCFGGGHLYDPNFFLENDHFGGHLYEKKGKVMKKKLLRMLSIFT